MDARPPATKTNLNQPLHITKARQTHNWLCVGLADGTELVTETKHALLEPGVAIFLGSDESADPAFGMELPKAWLPWFVQGATTDPVAVCLARRYYAAKNTLPFVERDVPIPTDAEAIAELDTATKWFPARADWTKE